MRKLLLFLFITILSDASIAVDQDNYFTKKILGIWAFKDTFDEISMYSEYLYKSDGTKEGYVEICQQNNCEIRHFKSTWRIKKGFLISIVQSSDAEGLSPKTKIIDKIIKLNNDEMVLFSKDGEEKNYRVKKSKFFES